jgi:hypothetical protein
VFEPSQEPTPNGRLRDAHGEWGGERILRISSGEMSLQTVEMHHEPEEHSEMSLNNRILRVAVSGTIGLAFAGGVAIAGSPEVHIFEAPGAGDTPGSVQGTVGVGINDWGVVAGITRDDNNVRHGYLRYPDGKYLLFDHPLAGSDGTQEQGTRVAGVNLWGAVVGSVRTAQTFDIPFVRDPDGTYHNVDFKNFGGGDGSTINSWGVMNGQLLLTTDNNSPAFLHFHGFIREADGRIVLFDPPGSQDTEIPNTSLNDAGTITGDYWTCNSDLSSCSVHGFIRAADGSYTTFDVPGASTDGIDGGGTYPQGISELGEVSGYFVDSNFIYHGFLRSPSGQIKTFDFPTTCTDTAQPPADCAYEGTTPANVNVLGTVTGTYYGEDGNPHGFVREANGDITRIDYPGVNYFTSPQAINNWGLITGLVYDPNLVVHGLLVTP